MYEEKSTEPELIETIAGTVDTLLDQTVTAQSTLLRILGGGLKEDEDANVEGKIHRLEYNLKRVSTKLVTINQNLFELEAMIDLMLTPARHGGRQG